MSLPSGYLQLEYIESTGTQYIDTGVVLSNNHKFEIEFMPFNSQGLMFGSRSSATLNNRMVTWDGGLVTNDYYNYQQYRLSVSLLSGIKYVATNSNTLIKINESELSVSSTTIFNTPSNALIFNVGGSPPSLPKASAKLYYAKIWNGEILVRDFIPSMRLSDNAIGLYDKANNQFYTNNGSGTFLHGGLVDAPLNIILEGNPIHITLEDDLEITANFRVLYTVTLDYDTTLGTATYEWGPNSSIILHAVPNENGQFVGWYSNSSPISTSPDASYNVYSDTTIEARFSRVWSIETLTEGQGAISYTRQQDKNIVEFTVIPNLNWHFLKYVVGYHYYVENEKLFNQLSNFDIERECWAYENNDGINIINSIPTGHKIFIRSRSKCITINADRDIYSYGFVLHDVNGHADHFRNNTNELNIGSYYIKTGIYTKNANISNFWVYAFGTNGIGGAAVGKTTIEIFDLTQIYGLGDEPTEQQFLLDYPNDYYSYQLPSKEYYTTPLNLILEGNVNVTAVFEENEKYHITANTNIPNGYIYISHNDDYAGYSSTLFARPIPDYIFDHWDDGAIENPRDVTDIESDLTFTAIFVRVPLTNAKYQYRCWVKDQLHLTDPPKAFFIADSFSIKKDLMTNAKSTISTYKVPSTISNGDILVLYNPFGVTIYQGVITSTEEKQIQCSQMQSFYAGTWIYNVNPQTYLEDEIKLLLKDYADGKIYGSTWTDPLVAQRLGGITIDAVGSTQVNLPTDTDEEGNEQRTTHDMEKWIYSLYEDYGIIFDFEINFSGPNYVHIKVPTYDPVKVGNNIYAIANMSPVETIEETNRLIIFAANNTYRTTYIATMNGNVEQPAELTNRFNIVKSKIVSSDDPIEDLVAANLPSSMYNHKITFDLIIKNFVYDFTEFNLGGQLDIWHGSDYYNSVLTGYEISKDSGKNVSSVHFICGKVRQKLTQLLTLGKV